jgi:hypothetical protein
MAWVARGGEPQAAVMGSMMAAHRTWADLQQSNGPPQLTHTISDVQHASSALGEGGDLATYLDFNAYVPSLLSAASSMHSLLLGPDSHMNSQVPATSAQLTSLFGMERANSVTSDARQAPVAAPGASQGLDSVYAFFQVRSWGPLIYRLAASSTKTKLGNLVERIMNQGLAMSSTQLAKHEFCTRDTTST